MKRIGDMRHRLVFQKGTKTADTYGGFSTVWTEDFALWCSVRQMSEAELLRNGQNAGTINYSCYCLYQDGLLPTSQHRVLWNGKIMAINAPVRDSDGKHVWMDFQMGYKEAAALSNVPVIVEAGTDLTGDYLRIKFSVEMQGPATNLFQIFIDGFEADTDSIFKVGNYYVLHVDPASVQKITGPGTFNIINDGLTYYESIEGVELPIIIDFPFDYNVIVPHSPTAEELGDDDKVGLSTDDNEQLTIDL